jgi:hypothetical protein
MLRGKEQRSEEQSHSQLQKWTEGAKVSEIAELEAFAVKLRQGTGAVVAAIVLTVRAKPRVGSTSSSS